MLGQDDNDDNDDDDNDVGGDNSDNSSGGDNSDNDDGGDNNGNGNSNSNDSDYDDNDNFDDFDQPPLTPSGPTRPAEPECARPGQDTTFTSYDGKVKVRIFASTPEQVRVEILQVIDFLNAPLPRAIWLACWPMRSGPVTATRSRWPRSRLRLTWQSTTATLRRRAWMRAAS